MVTSLQEPQGKPRPVHRNLHITQIASYRLPPAGIVSILHRITGAFVFLMLPFAIWLFDSSITSQFSYEQFSNAFSFGIGFVPGWLVKVVSFALLWAYLLHFCSGIRHVWMDATHEVGLAFGRWSAIAAMAIGTLVAFAVGAKLFLF